MNTLSSKNMDGAHRAHVEPDAVAIKILESVFWDVADGADMSGTILDLDVASGEMPSDSILPGSVTFDFGDTVVMDDGRGPERRGVIVRSVSGPVAEVKIRFDDDTFIVLKKRGEL